MSRSRAGDPATTIRALPWQVHTASAIGAGHIKDGRPNEDAVGWKLAARPDGSAVLAIAVADGHGDSRHFRSERGAKMAVSAGISAVLAWSAHTSPDAVTIQRNAQRALVPDIVARWNAAVAADLSRDPFTEAEIACQADAAQPREVAYGSTLLMAAFTAEYVVFAQIGDGNIVAVLPEGRCLSPVPEDSTLDGWRTTSLCQANASAAFRVGVIQLAASPLFAVLIATDGFGNAQAEDPWQPGVAADLVGLAFEHDLDWFAGQLPAWAAQCASSDGSGDDSTVALAFNSAVAPNPLKRRPGQPAQPVPATVPGRTLELFPSLTDETARGDLAEDLSQAGVAGGTGASRQAVVPRTVMWVGVGAALVAGAIVGFILALVLRGPAHHPPSPTPAPTHTSSQRPSPSARASLTPSPSASPGSSATATPSASPAPSQITAPPARPGAAASGFSAMTGRPNLRGMDTATSGAPRLGGVSMPGLRTSSQRDLG